jgi:hypothetical protein
LPTDWKPRPRTQARPRWPTTDAAALDD